MINWACSWCGLFYFFQNSLWISLQVLVSHLQAWTWRWLEMIPHPGSGCSRLLKQSSPSLFLSSWTIQSKKKKKTTNQTSKTKNNLLWKFRGFYVIVGFQWPCPSTLISGSLSAAYIRKIKTVRVHMYRCPSVFEKKDFDFSHFCSGLTPSFARCDVCPSVHAQSCLTLCNCVDCSPPGSSVHGKFQIRILEWKKKKKNTGVGCHFLLQGIFPTQGSNPCLLVSCVSYIGRRVLYHWASWEVPVRYKFMLMYTFVPWPIFFSKCEHDTWLSSPKAQYSAEEIQRYQGECVSEDFLSSIF